MLHFDVGLFQEAFDVNWTDWCLGGPRKHGWTRTGKKMARPSVSLVGHQRMSLSVKDVLSKNADEVNRWHIEFLKDSLKFGSKFHWKNSIYYREYISLRYSDEDGKRRADNFIDLLADVTDNGIKNPVWVADVGGMIFRFDGCHRACCAHVCGLNKIPALVFKTKVLM